ncbi:MAG TPA: ABC transporter substrate-binding protein [Dongiaceae bacterium]|jgi:dipeptide transport system substrate-binding protein|nr:ABC transporter substrate-binding protein [Dongiaceae bacterium]
MRQFIIGAAAVAALSVGGQAFAKNLTICTEGSPEQLSPHVSESGTTLNTVNNVYERLVRFKPGTTELQPSLAEKWDVSDDGKAFTFHLRHGVKFQSTDSFKPTRDFNADDVVATFERMWKKDSPYYKLSASYDYFGDMDMPNLLSKITKVDDYTVRFDLTAPNAPFLADLAMDFAAIDSKEYLDAMLKAGKGDQVDWNPVGTGPYQFVAYQKDAVIRYKRNETYWGDKPAFDTVAYVIAKDSAVRKAKLEAGECDIMTYPAAPDVKSLEANPNITVLHQAGLNALYLYLNVTKPYLSDKRVRQAISMAVDKDAIVKAVYQGLGQVAVNPIPPTMWAWNQNVKPYPYDPEAAKKLLKAAGVPDGYEFELWAQPVQRPYNPDGKKIAELLQSDLAKVGLKGKIVTYEWGEYRKRLGNHEGQISQMGWTGDNGDPDNFLNTLFACPAARIGGGNYSAWCDPKTGFSQLLVEAANTADQAKRKALYDKAQVIFHEEAPAVPIAHSTTSWPVSKKIKGFVVDPLDHILLSGVDKTE